MSPFLIFFGWLHRAHTSSWPLVITQATDINRPGCSRTTSPNVALCSSSDIRHQHGFRWQHRPWTLTWLLVIIWAMDISTALAAVGSRTQTWPSMAEWTMDINMATGQPPCFIPGPASLCHPRIFWSLVFIHLPALVSVVTLICWELFAWTRRGPGENPWESSPCSLCSVVRAGAQAVWVYLLGQLDSALCV